MTGAGAGAGSEIIQQIAAPIVGRKIIAPLLSMFLVPAVYLLLWKPKSGAGRRHAEARQVEFGK